MANGKFRNIWLAVTVLSFLIEAGVGELMHGALTNNGLVPWRLQPDAQAWFALAVAAIVGGFAFAYVFLQGYKGRGMAEGVRFGIWVTLLASVPENLGYAAMLPEGRRLPLEFIGGDLLTFVVCGAVAALIAGSAAAAYSASA